MVIHYTNIYNNVVFPDKKACIFRFKGRKSCGNGDSVTLEFMLKLHPKGDNNFVNKGPKTHKIQDGGMFTWKFKMAAILEKLYSRIPSI